MITDREALELFRSMDARARGVVEEDPAIAMTINGATHRQIGAMPLEQIERENLASYYDERVRAWVLDKIARAEAAEAAKREEIDHG